MTTANATSLMPLSVLDDDAWDDLLSFIEERRVIPAALLREAAALLDATSAEYRALHSTRLWRDRIPKAQRGEFPWTGRGKN